MSDGSRVTLLGQWAKFAIQLAAFVSLSRMLTPDDFGIVAMVSAVVAFATLLADSGLSLAGLQAPTLSDHQQSNLFWMNLAAGIATAAVVGASSPFLARFYGEPAVVSLAGVLAIVPVINGLAAQFRVVINRQLRFRLLALHDVLGAAAGLATGVGAAALGFGYWAIAYQTISQAAMLALLAIVQAGWLPGRPARWDAMSPLYSSGASNLGLQLMNMASRTVDTLAVGRAQAADALGIYSRSSQLVSMIFQQLVTPLTRVMVPRLRAQQSRLEFNVAVVRLQRTVTYSLLTIASLLAALAQPTIPLVLGNDWAPMVDVVYALCVGAVFQAVGYIYYWAFLALQRAPTLLLSEAPGRAVMIVGAVMLAPAGVEAVAWVMSLGLLVIWLASSFFFAPRLSLPVAKLTRVALTPLIYFGAAALTVLFARAALPLSLTVGPIGIAFSLLIWGGVVALGLTLPLVRHEVSIVISNLTGR